MASLDFKSLSVLDSAPFLGLKLEPSKSPNALSLGLEGMPETELHSVVLTGIHIAYVLGNIT